MVPFCWCPLPSGTQFEVNQFRPLLSLTVTLAGNDFTHGEWIRTIRQQPPSPKVKGQCSHRGIRSVCVWNVCEASLWSVVSSGQFERLMNLCEQFCGMSGICNCPCVNPNMFFLRPLGFSLMSRMTFFEKRLLETTTVRPRTGKPPPWSRGPFFLHLLACMCKPS